MRISPILVRLGVACFASSALAQSASPSLGEQIAKTTCIACHEIAPNVPAKDLHSGAPSFVDVANMPSTTELSIKVFLRSSHRSMPDFILSAEDIDSITAYILSLKKK